MTKYEQLEQKIAEQQKGQEGTNAYYVGMQLLDICRGSETLSEIVLTDLNNPKMAITDAEKKIAAYASAHRKGTSGCCPPQEADRILREFYGLPAAGAAPEKKSDGVIDMSDPDLLAFKMVFEQLQADSEKLNEIHGRILGKDPGTAEKLQQALRAWLVRNYGALMEAAHE